MSNIKRAYVELVALLETNSNKKVSTILPQVLELVTKSKNCGGSETGKTFALDDEGNVVAIFCYYHKKWELVKSEKNDSTTNVEYGKKASTASGLNTMCKVGVSAWTRQNRVATKAKEELLAKVSSGEIAPELIADEQVVIEETRKLIEPRDHGFETLEEALSSI